MTASNPCLVWDPIERISEGTLLTPRLIAYGLKCPIYTHHTGEENKDYIETFGRSSRFNSIMMSSPLKELYLQTRYATWKPPSEYNCFISRGPKSLHTVQRRTQDHIHYFNGTYRGFFLHKNKYQSFNNRSEFIQFLLGQYRLYMRSVIQSSINTIDTVVVDSELTRDVVESTFNREADAVIYPPVPIDDYSPNYRNDSFLNYYLYMGVVDDLHKTKEAIKAFNNLPYKLKIAGDGSKITELKGISEDNIDFCGYVEGKKKDNYSLTVRH